MLGFEIGFYQIVWLSQKNIFSVLYMYLNALRIKRISITTSFFPKSISHAWFGEGKKKAIIFVHSQFSSKDWGSSVRNHFEDAVVHALENSHNNIPLHIFIKEISYLRYF